MVHEIDADYSQAFVLPHYLDDFVPANHPARFIREFVHSLNMEKLGFVVRENLTGRPPYSARLLLKIWLYGYMHKIRSTRDLERACANDIGMLWLTGMLKPDHISIWRFFRDNKTLLREVFRQSVRVASDMDITSLLVNAIDGTKILADARQKRAFHREDLDELLSRLSDKAFDELCDEIERNEKDDDGSDYALPENLADRKKLREEIEAQLEKLDVADTDHLNKTDEDARLIKTEGGIKFCYNAQAAVDDKNGIIVSADVVQDAMDSHLLTGMLEDVKETLGDVAEENLADSGYFSGDELSKAEEMEANVLVNIKTTPTFGRGSDREYDISRFTYDEENDRYICPKGGSLSFRGLRHHPKKSYVSRLYGCDDYKECPFRYECSKHGRVRTLAISPNLEAIKRQMERQKNPDNLALLQKRKTIVEPIFGYIKHILGFRRWTVRGLSNVRAQWALICMAVNLRKMYRAWAECV